MFNLKIWNLKSKQIMDTAYKFEVLIKKYLGSPTHVTYSTYWNEKNKRVSLLFTACLIEYDKRSTGDDGQKLEYFMENLFKDTELESNISKECLHYLESL